MSKLAASLLLSASSLINPTTPKALSFDASAFVTADHQIRLAVRKSAELPIDVTLRNQSHEVLYQHSIGKKEDKYTVKLNVNDLADGSYELEIKSSEGSIIKQLNVSSQPVQQISRVIAMQ
ncbi:hypothetical protein GO730_08835 [Spirosoma sp. HMF3257]|uniref:DUF3244 domain-containing protein n=1 Tax=Spirosoma telluris TaxID=2183553 RepID=A0A327NSM5_9BACT|nr:hypothetical protein [Spirosoma telluris]RAI78391.1 hypothetical protein HMF3257_08750 [Spirosoma telluris]